MSTPNPAYVAPEPPRCRCGVYDYVHAEGRGCGRYRKASPVRLWLMDHSPVRHVAGRLWLAVPEKRRMAVVYKIYDRRPDLCWCDLFDSAWLDVRADDYRAPWGCGCHVPLPIGIKRPTGTCYCPPREAS